MKAFSRALGFGMSFALCAACLGQNGQVQDEHDKQIKADTARNTKYHNNADDYPVNKTAPTAPAPASKPAAPHLTSSDIHEMYASADAAAAERQAEFNRALNSARGQKEEDMMKVADYLIRGYGVKADKESAMGVYGAVAKLGPAQAYRVGMLLSGPGDAADNVEAWRAMKSAADGGVAAAKTWVAAHPEPVRHAGELPSIVAFVDGVYRQRGVGVKPTTIAEGDKIMADWAREHNKKYYDFKKIGKIATAGFEAGKATLYGVGVPVDFERATKLFQMYGGAPGMEYAGWAQWQALQKSGSKDLTGMWTAVIAADYVHSPQLDYLRAVYSFLAGDKYRERTFLIASIGYFRKDFSQSSMDLAVMELEGVGGPLNENAGISGLKEEILRGNHNAEYVLGLIYERGLHGVAKDPARAGQLFQAAASAGQLQAKERLTNSASFAKP